MVTTEIRKRSTDSSIRRRDGGRIWGRIDVPESETLYEILAIGPECAPQQKIFAGKSSRAQVKGTFDRVDVLKLHQPYAKQICDRMEPSRAYV